MMDAAKLDELRQRFPYRQLPEAPFVGLFGNHHNNWRNWATRLLNEFGLPSEQIYDSTDPGWQVVSDGNGDELQLWVDELVERQHMAMKSAAAIIFALDSHTRTWNGTNCFPEAAIPVIEGNLEGTLFAARCEIGWLAGIGKTVFVWISDDLEGRNYLRAVVRLYPSIKPCRDLYAACQMAAERQKAS